MRTGDRLVRALDVPPETLQRLAASAPRDYPVLFDSVSPGPHAAVSILAAFPQASLALDANGRLHAEGAGPRNALLATPGGGFLATLEAWWRAERTTPANPTASAKPTMSSERTTPAEANAEPGVATLPFVDGWVIYLGYEIAQEIEPHLDLPRERLPWRAFALRVPAALILDATSGRVHAVARAGDDGERWLERLAHDAAASGAAAARPVAAHPAARCPASPIALDEESPDRFIDRVLRAQDHIRAGDIYQANLSRYWRGAVGEDFDAGSLYASLRDANPAPFAAFAHFRDLTILSSSPERLVRIDTRNISTRPIAGTRPRSRRSGEDEAEAAALVSHPKERAEHVMLIDLERNDLGRVCRGGSVVVDEFMAVETYAHVHHIVSNVRGVLRDDVTPIAALSAVFPGGTITGCPKIRCMQIIAELEQTGRGAYTGSLGYLTPEGTADFNILIRTITIANGQIELRAGGGIVADSDPMTELAETRAKARGLLLALAACDGGVTV